MNKFFTTMLLMACLCSLNAQQPAIFTVEHISSPAAGIYETAYCDGKVKRLWADSTAGYTSYAWSNGDITPSVSIPTVMNMQQVDTLTLTVGLPGGGTATSEVRLIPSFIIIQFVTLYPANSAACAGLMDFAYEDHPLDSFIAFNNGFTAYPPFNSSCQTVSFNLPASPNPAGVRNLTNGCALDMTPIPFGMFPVQIPPTVTQNGSSFTATHPAQFGPMQSVYHWRDLTGTDLATGATFMPVLGTTFYCVLENISNQTLISGGSIGCAALNPVSCFTGPSDTLTYQLIGVADGQIDGGRVFPNPCNERFEIQDMGADVEMITVFDLQGRRVANLPPSPAGFDATALMPGFYSLHWQQAGQLRQARLAVAR